jgi:hypothetical protein
MVMWVSRRTVRNFRGDGLSSYSVVSDLWVRVFGGSVTYADHGLRSVGHSMSGQGNWLNASRFFGSARRSITETFLTLDSVNTV